MPSGWIELVSEVVRADTAARRNGLASDAAALKRLTDAAQTRLASARTSGPGPLATRLAVALRLLGPATPLPDDVIEQTIALAGEVAIGDDDVDLDNLALDVVTAYGVGWRRTLDTGSRDWQGYWPKAYTRFHRLVRQCSLNTLGGLADRVGVWFPTDRPDPELLASELVSLLTDPVTPAIRWPLTIWNKGPETAVRSADHEYSDVPHGSKIVFEGQGQALAGERGAVQRRYERDSRGRAIEVNRFLPAEGARQVELSLQGEPARLVVAARYAETSVGAPRVDVLPGKVTVRLDWEESLKEGMALELRGQADTSVVKCTCGHYRCAALHRLDAWSPAVVASGFEQMVRAAARDWQGHREVQATGYWRVLGEAAERLATRSTRPRLLPLTAFVYAAVSGSYGPVKMKSFKDGMLYGTLSSGGW